MTLRDLFGLRLPGEVTGTKVLACSLGSKFTDLLTSDSKIYSSFYHATTNKEFSSVGELLATIGQRYDVVHLLCDVSPDGVISDERGGTISGTSLIEKSCKADLKLLWVASENKPESYIKGFKTGGNRINLVMTISRNGSNFSLFLKKLLSKLCSGETMPTAWAKLAPQGPGPWQQELPGCIFSAGLPNVRLR